MARSYSQKFLLLLNTTPRTGPGVELANLCVECNIPASYVAKAMDVSRMTIYSWFRGKEIRKSLLPKVEAFLKLIKEDIDAGVLPAKGNIDAKLYIEKMIGATL